MEEGFTVRDRRRFLAEETGEPPPSPPRKPGENAHQSEPEAAAVPASAEMPRAEDDSGDKDASEDTALPDVYTVLAMFLSELRNLAWLRMGLVANPVSGQIERDLTQAKVAIDTVAFLATRIEGTMAMEERLPLRALVSDLQINFVEQSKRG